MHEGRESLPFEYAVIALWIGLKILAVVLGTIFIVSVIKAAFRRPEDLNSPFMTPELKRQMKGN